LAVLGVRANDSERRVPLSLLGAHRLLLELLAELLRQPANQVEERRAEDGEADGDDDVAAQRVLERDPRRTILLGAPPPPPPLTAASALKASAALMTLSQAEKMPRATRPHPLESALLFPRLERSADSRLDEAPDRIAAEPDRESSEQETPVARLRNLLESSRPVLDLARSLDCDLDRQEPDEAKGRALGDEA
jgi:hypothetical protein